MKKLIAIYEVLITGIISVSVNCLLFVSLYASLQNAEYSSLAFSIYIIMLSLITTTAFVLIFSLRSLKNSTFCMVFSFFSFLAMSVFIFFVIKNIGSNYLYWILSIVNLSFALCNGIAIYQNLRVVNKSRLRN